MIEETKYKKFIKSYFTFNPKYKIGDNVRFLMYKDEVVSYDEFKDKDIKNFCVDDFKVIIGKIKDIALRGVIVYTIESYNCNFRNDNYIVRVFEDALSYFKEDNNK